MSKACDDIPGTCDDYPSCACGRAWTEHEKRLAAAREGGAHAAAIVRPLHRSLTDVQFEADVALLNDNAVHVVTRRDEHGHRTKLSRETIHALAEVVRCLNKAPETSEDSASGR